MANPRRTRFLHSMLALGCIIAGLISPITAAPAEADDRLSVNLSLKPVDQKGSYFALTINPGQSQQLKVELGNHGTEAISTRTYAADAYSINNGGFGAKGRDSTATGTTTWLSYPGQVLQLPAGQASIRTFTVAVPAATAPGEYITSLILENDVPIQGSGSVVLNQIVRQAVAVSIRVPGLLQPSFVFGAASHKITADRSVIDIGTTNTGNAILKPAGSLAIRDHNGKTVSQSPVTMDSFYAHTDTRVEATLDGKLQPGDYTVSLTLADPATKVTATGTDLKFTVAQETVQITPDVHPGDLPQILQDGGAGISPYIVATAVLAVLAALFLLVRRRFRRTARAKRAGHSRRRVSSGDSRK